MNIVLLGIQGCGKGTLVLDLNAYMDFTLVSMGELLRQEVASGSELGQHIKKTIDLGILVDLNIIMETISKKLQTNSKEITIFDGFPRNTTQADELDKICHIDKVIYLNLRKEDAKARVLNRLTCKKCGNITSRKLVPDMICPVCGSELEIRSDDNIEALEKRFELYERETLPLVERYKRQGVLFEIDASKPPHEVFNDVMKVLS